MTSERVPASDAIRDAPALSVHDLSKRFGARVAFEDVSFEVGYGEVFGFLGPNGAGKTTTVRTLGTLLAPTPGGRPFMQRPDKTQLTHLRSYWRKDDCRCRRDDVPRRRPT